MRIRVLAFATASEALGSGELEVELPDGSDLATLRRELAERRPALEPLWPRLALAVDGELSGPETRLRDGSEVALLPPVSGGANRGRVELVNGPLDIEATRARVAGSGRGATVLFLGTARDRHLDRPVRGLRYTAYRGMAERALEQIVAELEAETEGLCLAVSHRLGEVEVGEVSVVIAAASPHRDEAYRGSRRALERLKREVPIWKQELYADGGSDWREEEPLASSESCASQVQKPASSSFQP